MFNYLVYLTDKFQFGLLDFIIMIFLFIMLNSLFFQNTGELRILVFFIYFEMIQLLFIFLVLSGQVFITVNGVLNMVICLFLVGISGSETAIFLILFMLNFRFSGTTLFLNFKQTGLSLLKRDLH